MNKPILWVVGQYKHGEFPDIVWEFQGVFETEELAIDACRTEDYFIAPTRLNKNMPHETVSGDEWGWYPHLEDAPNAVKTLRKEK